MLFDTAAAALDWLGVIVFAVSGALVASRKQMDIVGFALLGTVTGIGGGTLRDLLLGQGPVFWVREPAYLIVCVIVSGVVFVTAHIPQSRYRVLLWFDALGLALFAVTGAERALLVGSGTVVAVAMGSSRPPSAGSSATYWATRARWCSPVKSTSRRRLLGRACSPRSRLSA